MSTATSTERRVRPSVIKQRQRQIEAWYPYEPKIVPAQVSPDSFFVTDPHVRKMVEGHLIPKMPAAVFFSGSFHTEPGGTDALQDALSDFEAILSAAGHVGRFFAVAARSYRDKRYHAPNQMKGRIHVHAIVDYGPNVGKIGRLWSNAHGKCDAGLADPGAHYYVIKHDTNAAIPSLVLDRTWRPAPV